MPNADCRFNGSRAVLSGPAGGVVGYALTTYDEKTGPPVIGFDMGGERTLQYYNNIIVISGAQNGAMCKTSEVQSKHSKQ